MPIQRSRPLGEAAAEPPPMALRFNSSKEGLSQIGIGFGSELVDSAIGNGHLRLTSVSLCLALSRPVAL